MSIISAGTSSSTAVKVTGNTDGTLVLRTNDTGSGGTTALTLATNQAATFASSVSATAFSGPLNGTVGATTPNTGAFTTLTATGLVKSEFSTGTTAPVAQFGSTGATNRGVWIGVGADGNTLIQAYRPSDGSTTAFPLNIGASNATVASFNTTGLAVTGTLSSTGKISFSGSVNDYCIYAVNSNAAGNGLFVQTAPTDTSTCFWIRSGNGSQNVIKGLNDGSVTIGNGLAVTGTLSSTGAINKLATGDSADVTLQLGADAPAINRSARIAFFSANAAAGVRNWFINSNWNTAGALDFAPSTTNGGTTMGSTVVSIATTGLAVTGTITGPTSISIGTNPAATGELRIPNTGSIYSRNAANSNNLQIAGFTSADVLQLNNGALTASVANGSTLNLGALQTGLLVVVSNVDFTGVFVISNLVTYELSDPDSKYSVTAGTASSINLYDSAGSVILQNNSGGTRSFYITHIK